MFDLAHLVDVTSRESKRVKGLSWESESDFLRVRARFCLSDYDSKRPIQFSNQKMKFSPNSLNPSRFCEQNIKFFANFN